MARIEQAARHPQSPTAKWAKYLAGVQEAAIKSAEARASRDASLKRRTEYAKTAATQAPKG